MLRLKTKSLKLFLLFALITNIVLILRWLSHHDYKMWTQIMDRKNLSTFDNLIRSTKLIEDHQNLSTFEDLLRSATLEPCNSSYHRYYSVNCTAVFSPTADLEQLMKIALTHIREPIRVPSDAEVTGWFRNCRKYKEDRNYPTRPSSMEEEEFPIAFDIVTYKDAAQVERLLRSIYQPQNVYCIHTDLKSNITFRRAIANLASCFDNVFIASKLEKIQWGGISATLADNHCMENLLRHPIPWKYFINLCGQDFPLKTNFEIVQQLKAYNGHNCILSDRIKKGSGLEGRYKYKYLSPSFNEPPKLVFSSDGKLHEKDPPPFNITMYKGDTYIAATRKFVDFVVSSNISKAFLAWLNDTYIPDESFTNSLQRLPQAPGGYPYGTNECNVKFRRWGDDDTFTECYGRYVRGICIFRSDYLQILIKQPHLFVNKFHYDYDPVTMQCMEEMLEYRRKRPGILQKVMDFPVTNYSWQHYTSPNYVPGV